MSSGCFWLFSWYAIQCDYLGRFNCAWVVPKKSPLTVVHLWLHLGLFLDSFWSGAPVGALWTHNLELYTCAASAVVWLGWGVEICEVGISCILELRCPIVWRFSYTSVLFCIKGLLSTLGLPHILIGVLKLVSPHPFYSCTWYQNLLIPGWILCPCIGM